MPDETLPARRPRPVLIPARLSDDGIWLPRVRRMLIALFAVHVVLAIMAGPRFWWQVYDMRVTTPARLARGEMIRADIVTSGRTTVDLTVALWQGARVDTLGHLRVPGNWNSYDPRLRRGTLRLVMGRGALAGFAAGPALLRVTAVGRPQLMRLPPPTVRETTVNVVPGDPRPSTSSALMKSGEER